MTNVTPAFASERCQLERMKVPAQVACVRSRKKPRSGVSQRLLVLPFATLVVSALALFATEAAGNARPGDTDLKADAAELDGVVVIGRRQNLVGEAISASEGFVGPAEIAAHPILRSGDLLEFVPGLVGTQHSGSGKANQYFLRGFNLDHGTDFATHVDAMPVNMRTHGHGQGYTDLNFLIPEAVEELRYRKGVYYADVGDFSSAGSARFQLASRVEKGHAEIRVGSSGYLRGVAIDSLGLGNGTFLYAAESQTYDGPWTNVSENVGKNNLLLRYTGDVADGRGALTLLGYDNSWNSPDQIPQRAVERGLIDELGSIDTTLGGSSSRSSLSADWNGALLGGRLSASAFAIDYEMSLYSNFTYLLEDPVNGDQIRQRDERRVYGFAVSQQWEQGRSRWRAGAEGRFDDIDQVGLFRTSNRQPVATVRDDAVREGSLGLYLANELQFGERWRTYSGIRYDYYDFDVDSISLPANSGRADDGLVSLKGSVIYRPVDLLELNASAGQGFHSNDARGTAIRFDPASGEPVAPVDPLVRSTGYEVGARIFLNGRFHATAALWRLRLDSELVFVGDAGTTEVSPGSHRDGAELGLYWFGGRHIEGDIEVSYTDAHFAGGGDEMIAGAIPLVVSASLTGRADRGPLNGLFWTLHVRHFGSYPLIEDGSVESEGSTLVNFRAGTEWKSFGLFLDVFNLLDSKDHDIDYYYASRLSGELGGGVDDIHYHPAEPRSVRISLRRRF